MKRFSLMLMAISFATAVSAQYDVGTSTTTTDYFGNQKTTHRNQYGEITGTSTTTTDYRNNKEKVEILRLPPFEGLFVRTKNRLAYLTYN